MDELQDFYGSTDDDLALRHKAALAQLLRQAPSGGLGNISSKVMHNLGTYKAQAELPQIESEQRRRDLDSQRMLADALRNDPELQALATKGNKDQRKLATAQWLKDRSRQKELESIGSPGGGDQVPPLPVVTRMMGSSDPSIKAQGEAYYKAYYTPHTPGSSVTFNAQGGYSQIPGALGAFEAQENVRNTQRAMATAAPEQNIGGNIQPTESLAKRLGIGQPQRALPMSAPPPETAMPPGPSALPGATGAMPGLPPPDQVVAQIRAADAARRGQPYTGRVEPNGQVSTQSAPGALPPPVLKPAPNMRLNPAMQKQLEEDMERYSKLDSTLQALSSMERLNADPKNKMSRGGLDTLVNQGIGYVAPLFGATGENLPITKDRQFDANANRLALQMTELLKGQTSDKDIAFLKAAQTASTDNPAARSALLKELRDIAERNKMKLEQRWNPTEPTAPKQQGPVGKQSAAESPYWNMQAGVGEVTPTSALPGSTQALAQSRKGILSEAAEGINQGIGVGGIGLAQFPGVAELVNRLPKVGRLKEIGEVQKPSYEDVKMVRENAPSFGPAGKAGQFAGEMATDPTMYAPGGGVLAAALKGVLSGKLRPSESADESAVNMVSSGVLGPLGTLASKAIPPTRAAKDGPPQFALDQAKEFGVNLTRFQLNPESFAARAIGNKVTNLDKPKQLEAITESLLKEAGSKETRVTDKVIADRHKEITDEFAELFKGQSARVGSTEGKQLRAAISEYPMIEDLMAKGPKLARIHDVLTNTKNKTYPKFKLEDIQGAWDELGAAAKRTPEGQQIKTMLESIMEKNVGEEGMERLGTLLRQRDTLRDLETVWAGGTGQGAGRMAGTMSPAALQEWGGRLPNDTAVGKAGGLAKALDLHEYHPNQLPYGWRAFNPAQWAGEIPGIGAANKSMVNSPDWQKKPAEALRLGIAVGPREMRESSQE